MRYKDGKIELNWFERVVADGRASYTFLFCLSFAAVYFYFVNLFLPIFDGLISLFIIPMLVGGCIGLTVTELINIKWRRKWKTKN